MDIEKIKQKIDSLIEPYIERCQDKHQPIYTVINNRNIHIYPEFLNCLPIAIQELVIEAVNELKQS